MTRLTLAAVLVASFASRVALADARQECVQAADAGQTQRDQGKLEAARASFVACARETCPAVVANQCALWLGEVNRDLPTLSFRAVDAAGKELVDVQVFVDGVLKVRSMDGRATLIDPGPHHLRFVHPGAADVEQDIVAHVGDRDRPVEAKLVAGALPVAPAAAPGGPASDSHFRFPVFAGVSLGVSAASFVAMGVLVGTTASDVDHLRSTCAGSCSQSDVSSANTRIVAANVMMGLGIVAAGAAVTSLLVVNLRHPDQGSDTTTGALVLRAGPGSLGLAGSF